MTLEQMAKACGGILHEPAGIHCANEETAGVVIDSRKAEKGSVFVATKGERVDGHSFIPDVFKKGALGVICERAPEQPEGAYILVKDSFQALKEIAEAYRQMLAIPVVGITGSVGKTSTKEMIASVLAQRFQVLKTDGNYNNEVGLPLTVMRIRPEHTAAVLEMGISEFGEMHRLSKITKPDVCVITNIGQCHLETLHTRDGILKAKSEIFDFMADNAFLCLNGDDDKLCTLSEVKGIRPVFFGLSGERNVYADEIEDLGLFGSRFVLHADMEGIRECFPVEIHLPGTHMIYNALAAAAVGFHLGLTPEQIQTGIASVKPLSGRSNLIRTEQYTVIDDCYNASPATVKGALDLLATAKGRRVAVLGDMFELGENEVRLHEEIGAYAKGKADVLLCVGRLSAHMHEAARQNGAADACYYFPDRETLEEELKTLLKEGDTILVKASHGMELSHVVEMLTKN